MLKWLAAAAVMIAAAPNARGGDLTLEQTPGACDAREIEDAIAALVGETPHAAMTIAIATETAGKRVVGRITWPASGTERTVDARDCEELARSMAIVIATTLEPEPEPEPEKLPPRTPRSEIPRIAAPMHRGAYVVDVAVGGAGQGTRRGAIVAGVALRRGELSIGVEAATEPAVSIDVGGGGAVELSRTRFALLPCARFDLAPGRARVAACGIAAAGWLTGRGTGLDGAAEITRPVVHAGARAAVELSLSRRLAVELHVDGLQALTTTRFLVDHMPAWATDPRELWVGAGVEATFP